MEMVTKRKSDIQVKRQVLHRLIDIILFIGMQGLAYRATFETAADLNNKQINHGNFLELVLLLANYDQVLKDHVDQAIKNSQERKANSPGLKGRSALLTFLSKPFINKLIKYMAIQIQVDIANEIRQAMIFSIEVDSTQDIAIMDQLALFVRYVLNGRVRVRLLKMIVAKKTTGKALYLQIKSELDKFQLAIKQIVGCSFDGAANMSGQYNGLQAQLKKDNPSLVYVHCHAHALNLVMTNSTESCKSAKDFLGLLQITAVFISESHKRMLVWTMVNRESSKGNQLLRLLQKVNATRWWSKDKALQSVIDDPNVPLKDCKKFLTLLICLHTIAIGDDFASDVSFKAKSLLDNWCKFENILIAFVYRDLFNVSTPVSKYLQTDDLDCLKASNLIKTLHAQISEKRKNFTVLHRATSEFVANVQERILQKECEITIEQELPEKRVPIAKKHPGEVSADESRQLRKSPTKAFEFGVFNVIIDTAQQQIQRRFIFNDELMNDIALLDPRNFAKIQTFEMSRDELVLRKLSELSNTNRDKLFRELCQFSIYYESYNPKPKTQIATAAISALSSSDHEEEDQMAALHKIAEQDEIIEELEHCDAKEKCKHCLVCALELLQELNTHGKFYTTLYIAYKFVLTLSCTQVSCERVFSVLKIIKNRLRSSLGQELLEDFVLFYVERNFQFDYEKIIDDVASSSTELTRLLKL